MSKRGLLREGALIITDNQEKGKGQRGNVWISEPGTNLTFSVFLAPHNLQADRNFFLNMMASVAIAEGLKNTSNLNFKIKWPNDIYYEEHKIGGILIENGISSKIIDQSIIGIGININQRKFNRMKRAISLRNITGSIYDLNKTLNRITSALESKYLWLNEKKDQNLKNEYVERLYWRDEIHQFSDKGGIFEGMIRNVDHAGRLEVETGGKIRAYNFKEISFVHD